MLFDTHAHLDDRAFDTDREALIAALPEAGIGLLVNHGCSLLSSKAASALAERYPFIYAAVGSHPDAADEVTENLLDAYRQLVRENPKVVAIGEIGLDYHWDPDGKERQMRLFDAQLSMAEELSLPVIVHDRDAHGDAFDVVRAHPHVRGVYHSFSGSAEMARQLSRMGWYISFSGTISYKNAAKVREAAAVVPHARLLIETDAPYLAPVPHRGKINYSGYVPCTARALANAIGLGEEETVRLTTQNAKNLFGIK